MTLPEIVTAAARRATAHATATKLAQWQLLINTLFGCRQRTN